MHDIGKVYTPLEILDKPDKLTDEEYKIMKRHVVDGAHVLRRTPETPALAPVVAFEHHLRQDLSGYPRTSAREHSISALMVVSVCGRVRCAAQQSRLSRRPRHRSASSTSWDSRTARRSTGRCCGAFVNLMGLFPIGTLVRLNTEELAVVTQTHPDDPVPAAG